MTNEDINKIVDSLCEIEALVEKQGQRICSNRLKSAEWNYCNEYLSRVQDLIRGAWHFQYMDT